MTNQYLIDQQLVSTPSSASRALALACPNCDEADQVRKASAIFQDGTTITNSTHRTTGGMSGYQWGKAGGLFIGSMRSKTRSIGHAQTELARRLAPPTSPRLNLLLLLLAVAWSFWGYTWAVHNVDFVYAAQARLTQSLGASGAMSMVQYGPAALCILLEFLRYSGAAARYAAAMNRWRHRWYCYRCDYVFERLPDALPERRRRTLAGRFGRLLLALCIISLAAIALVPELRGRLLSYAPVAAVVHRLPGAASPARTVSPRVAQHPATTRAFVLGVTGLLTNCMNDMNTMQTLQRGTRRHAVVTRMIQSLVGECRRDARVTQGIVAPRTLRKSVTARALIVQALAAESNAERFGQIALARLTGHVRAADGTRRMQNLKRDASAHRAAFHVYRERLSNIRDEPRSPRARR